jgi:hypothetical protein
MNAGAPSHIPHAIERAALQKMSLTKGLRPEHLYPAGKQIIAGMLRKGWIEKQPDGSTLLHYPCRRRSIEGDYSHEALSAGETTDKPIRSEAIRR